MDGNIMDRIKILKQRAAEISARMKVLGIPEVTSYIAKLIKHDLWVQGFRKRIGVVPFSEHHITWKDLFKLIKRKIKLEWRHWRNPDWYD